MFGKKVKNLLLLLLTLTAVICLAFAVTACNVSDNSGTKESSAMQKCRNEWTNFLPEVAADSDFQDSTYYVVYTDDDGTETVFKVSNGNFNTDPVDTATSSLNDYTEITEDNYIYEYLNNKVSIYVETSSIIGKKLTGSTDSNIDEEGDGDNTEHVHTWNDGEVTTAATCTEEGVKTYTCMVCGATETETIATTSHTWSETYSYDDDGHWRVCTVCDEKSDAAAHTYDADNICTVCEYELVDSTGLEYTAVYDSNGATIVSYTVSGIGTCTDTGIVIPSTYNNLPVTAIAASAFSGQTQITSVYVPDSVTSIGSGAFSGCSGLVCMTLPFVGGSANATEASDLTYFGYIFGTSRYTGSVETVQAYYTTYYIPATLTIVTIVGGEILYGAFWNCTSLTSVSLGSGVTTIGRSAFSYCTSLTSITIPDSVTSIDSYAFEECYLLTSITVSSGNTVYKSIDGNLYSYDGKTLIQYAIGKTDISFTIPNSVTSIGNFAFYYCTSLISVIIPDSVTKIGEWTFGKCALLTSIKIPNSVTTISYCAFAYCYSLASIAIPNSVKTIGKSAFLECISLTSVYYSGTASEWSAISIGSSNTYLTSATIYYYSESGSTTVAGNYWYYDNDGNIKTWGVE